MIVESLWSFLALFLAPAAALASTILMFIVFFSPGGAPSSPDHIALMTISPNRLIRLASDPANNTADGPTIRMGPLGSCSQPNNTALASCTTPSLSPIYDLSLLPSNSTIANPSPGSTGVIFVSIILWTIFTLFFLALTYRESLSLEISDFIGRFERVALWLGNFSWLIGLTAFGANFGTVKNTVTAFNVQASEAGPPIQANVSFGFQLAWAAYGSGVLPLLMIFSNIVYAYKKELSDVEKSKAEKMPEARRMATRALYDAILCLQYIPETREELKKLKLPESFEWRELEALAKTID